MANLPEYITEHQIINAKPCWLVATISEKQFKKKYKGRALMQWRVGETCLQIKILMDEEEAGEERGINFHVRSTLVSGAVNILYYQMNWFSSYLRECKSRMRSSAKLAVRDKKPKRTKPPRARTVTDATSRSADDDEDDIPNLITDEDVIFVNENEPIFPPVLPADVHVLEEYNPPPPPDPTTEPGYFPALTSLEVNEFLENPGLPINADGEEMRVEAIPEPAEISDALMPPEQASRSVAQTTPSKRRYSEPVSAPDTPSKRKRKSAGQLFGIVQPIVADEAPNANELEKGLTMLENSPAAQAQQPQVAANADTADDLYNLLPIDEDISVRRTNRKKKKMTDSRTQLRPNQELPASYFEHIPLSERAQRLDRLQWRVNQLLSMPGKGWRSSRKFHRFNEQLLENFMQMILAPAITHDTHGYGDAVRMDSSTPELATLSSNILQVGQESTDLPSLNISTTLPVVPETETADAAAATAPIHEELMLPDLPDTTEIHSMDGLPEINLAGPSTMDQEITTTEISPERAPSPSSRTSLWTTDYIDEKLCELCENGRETTRFELLAGPELASKQNAVRTLIYLGQLNKEDKVRLNQGSFNDEIFISLTATF